MYFSCRRLVGVNMRRRVRSWFLYSTNQRPDTRSLSHPVHRTVLYRSLWNKVWLSHFNKTCTSYMKSKATFLLWSIYFDTFVHYKSVATVLLIHEAKGKMTCSQCSIRNCTNVVGRLTWLVYIIGAVIGGRVSFASKDEHDAMDGELVCR